MISVFARRAIVLAVFVSLSFAFSVSAATVRVGEEAALPLGEIVNPNVYMAVGTAIVSAPVDGDVTVAAGAATFSGPISGTLFVAGGTVEVLGPVSENIRAVGGKLTLTSSVSGDTLLIGGDISVLPTVKILGDALIAGGQVSLLGSVGKSAYLAGGDVFIDGHISGNVHVYAAGQVRIGPNAVIDGDITYQSSQEALIDSQAVITGETHFEYSAPLLSARDVHGFFAGLFGVAFVIRILLLMTAALLFVLVFRRVSVSLVNNSLAGFWKMVLVGFVVLIVVPFASIIILITIFGGLISAIMMAVWGLLILIAQVYAGVLFASIVQQKVFRKPMGPVVSWWSAVLGVLGLSIIGLVPYVGLLIWFGFFLAALGALSFMGYRHFLLSR
ncbi:MAG: hypothetical protein A2664_04715 [Candidatus Taylorbacteria bacterium RIFCSPHIGHO2_01_FULL_46_22b]|uniref:Polymer-forming cytoskeletal protein n=1 Tax=Candidatus Taylorbacteria bacterium RIFCSPHIGHO2_01_FULL_46_22b TaxID=1802301 RepID=A0A1G2M6V2_9BACT|nr:MAG: hypothetical protein A2664_04715 [Candidatus Taylorbacteria bacterium RIFCSPHIGHO2_01_FULL_46_22b]